MRYMKLKNGKPVIILMAALLTVAITACNNESREAPTQEVQPTEVTTDAETPTETVIIQQEETTTAEEAEPYQFFESDTEGSIVYMTEEISPEALMKAYQALNREATGKVAIKLSMGEPGGNYYLSPDLIKELVQSVDGTIVDCNTAYGGRRASTALHQQVAEDHGFTAIAPVDILDAEDEISLPVTGGTHLKEDIVGAHYNDYDFVMVLSHFKGHEMGGFGGAIKNISIGFASSSGKNQIHSAGNSLTSWSGSTQDTFLESMAEAASAIAADRGERILYINVMNNLSVDCDCSAYPAKPAMEDIGILASLDPVALDQACVDLVYLAEDGQSLVKRIESKNGLLTLEHAEKMGLGARTYQLVRLDE